MKFFEKYWIFIVAVFAVFMFIESAVSLFILGSLFLFSSIWGVLFLQRLEKSGVDTRGVILEYDVDRKRYRSPIIEFHTSKNERVKNKPIISNSLSALPIINSQVVVRYDPDKPEEFVIKETIHVNYLFLVFFGMIGITMNVLSVLEFFHVTNLL